MEIDKKAVEMGLVIPNPPEPVGVYVPVVRTGNLLFTSGQLPVEKGKLIYRGKVGRDLEVKEGYKAARLCVLNCLGVIKKAIGSLDKIEKIIKITGYVHSEDSFYEQAKVINGASELLEELLAEKGKHVRVAVGVNSLPLGAAVEISMILEVNYIQ